MDIVFFGFGNPDNRGCEALLRTTTQLTKEQFPEANCVVLSNDFGLREMPKLSSVSRYEKSFYPRESSLTFLLYYGMYRLFSRADILCNIMNRNTYRNTEHPDVCISIGGDNFCYNTRIACYTAVHAHYKKQGAKLIHWGSSFEKNLLCKELLEDLKRFDLILVRESLSKEALASAGITGTVHLVPDPAFMMSSIIPNDYSDEYRGCVGINISPLISYFSNEKNMLLGSIIELINYITVELGERVLFIPHVTDRKSGEGDYSTMQELLKLVKRPNMCTQIGYGYSAQEYKYIISQCRIFMGARTHATIAAYSSCVPTMVLGYSVKSRGIAKDILGNDNENYVVPVDKITSMHDLVDMYRKLVENETQVRTRLHGMMPMYIAEARKAIDFISQIILGTEALV